MFRSAIFEVDGMTVGAHHGVMRGIVRHPQLHVGDVEGIADVYRIVEQDRRAVVSDKLRNDAALAVGPRTLEGVMRDGALERLFGAFGVEVFSFARVLEDLRHGIVLGDDDI
jgi:hypothetical protein